jgi:hypothetical protein
MILQYESGKTIEGVALSSTDSTMRVALRGHNDVIELVRVDGQWISEDCELVRIQTAWQMGCPSRQTREVPQIQEAELVCPREVAFQLARLMGGAPSEPTPCRVM